MKKVLISRLSSLGDIVLTQPVIAAIHQAGDEVTLLVNDAYRSFAALLPGVSNIILPDQKIKEPFDLLLDLHKTGRSKRALKTKQFKKKIVYKKYSLSRRMLIRPYGKKMFWNNWALLKGHQSVVKWYADAAETAGYLIKNYKPALTFDKVDEGILIKKLQMEGVDFNKKIVIVAPGAKWATKRWPEEYYIQLIQKLTAKDYQTVLIGNHEEFHIGKRIRETSHKTIISLIGKTALSGLAMLMSKATLLISNDSGPLHIGQATGVKTVAIFGPTVKEFGFMPEHENCRVVEVDLPCRPCSLHGSNKCPLGHHDCMKKIKPEAVMKEIMHLGL